MLSYILKNREKNVDVCPIFIYAHIVLLFIYIIRNDRAGNCGRKSFLWALFSPMKHFQMYDVYLYLHVATYTLYLSSYQHVRTRYIVTVAAALLSLAYISHGVLSIQTPTS